VDSFDLASEGGHPVVGEVRDNLLEPFIVATHTALSEMAGTEVMVRTIAQTTFAYPLGAISAVIGLRSTTEGSLVLSFPEPTAAALARRVLAGVTEELDENLVRDCVGETLNVIAGQAKALLAETPYRFAFSMPTDLVGASPELRPKPGLNCLVIAFSSELGEFALQLVLEL
jgi:chemotaxis protein CheX